MRLALLPLGLVIVQIASAASQKAEIEAIRTLISEGHVPEALRQLESLHVARPDDATLQMQIGEILQELGASRAERLRQLAPDSPQAHELAGKSLEAHQRLTEALNEYQRAAEKSPDLPGVQFLIGNVYWKLGELGQAKASFERELLLNPAHPGANLRMGQVVLRSDENQAQAAIPYLKKAVSSDPGNLEAHRELGKALRLVGKPSEALAELKLVATKRPEDTTIHAQLAAVYRALGDSTAARREMKRHNQILQAEHARAITVR